jgi:hypothetical protein
MEIFQSITKILGTFLFFYLGFIGRDFYKQKNCKKTDLSVQKSVTYIGILNKSHEEKLYNLLENSRKN